MRLVLANHPGDACVAVRALRVREIEALTHHFRDGVDAPWLSEWLARLARMRLWIDCECRSMREASPMLFARRTPEATYALARMLDRPAHARGCPFGVAPASVRNADELPEPPRLVHLMCRWFAAARLNVLFPYTGDDGLSAQYAALREVSRSMEVWPGQPLYDFGRTHPHGLPELCRKLSRSAHDTQGVYLSVTSRLDSGELLEPMYSTDAHYQVDEELPPLRTACGSEPDRGPFVVLFLLAGAKGVVRIREVVAQPIHSRRLLVPLDGVVDRRTLEVLLDVQRRLLVGWGRVVTIRKTLCNALPHERGVSFQVQSVGPNGRAVLSFDVLAADAEMALADRVDLEQGAGPIYHAVGATEGPLTPTDVSFRSRVLSRLLDHVAHSGGSQRPAAPTRAIAS